MPRSLRALAIARERRWFDESVDLKAEIKIYSDGFKTGYLKLQTKFNNNPVYFHETVFSAAIGGTLYLGIYPCAGLKLGTLKPFEWFKLGELLGREYCAWCIVLENQDKFEPIFKDYKDALTSIPTPPQPVTPLSEQETIDSTIRPVKNTGRQNIGMAPTFKPEAIGGIFNILKDFFSIEDQTELIRILKTGNNTNEQLIFLDSGNRLADVFKQFFETGIITGCDKKELERWICKNFNYRYRREIKSFTADYIEKCISRNDQPCKNPILKIENGEIKKIDKRERIRPSKY